MRGKLQLSNSSTRRQFNGPTEGGGDEFLGAFRGRGVVYFRADVMLDEEVAFVRMSSFDFAAARIEFDGNPSNITVTEVGATQQFNSGVTLPAGVTHTLVAKVDFEDDLISLFVNPSLDRSEGTPDLSQPYIQTNFSTAIQIGSFGTGTSLWDNIMVATEWEDLVTPTEVTTLTDEDDGSLDPTAGGGTGLSLREAILYSPEQATIFFDDALSGKTITLTRGELLVDQDLKIVAPANGLTIDANRESGLMSISEFNNVSLTNLSFTGSAGVGVFEGITNRSSNLTLNRCTLYDNLTAAINNDGQDSGKSATLTLNSCTLTGNTGGAIANQGTFDGNAVLFVNNSTISNNFGFGGIRSCGVVNGTAMIHLNNSIIAGNQATDSNNTPNFNERESTTTASGVNLLSDFRGLTVPSIENIAQQTVVGNPRLAPLANYGGPTLTMHPLADSPAILTSASSQPSTNSPPRIDQRGFQPDTLLTIGAVQVGPVVRTVTESAGAGNNTLRQAFNIDPNDPNANTDLALQGAIIRFDPSLDGETITLNSQLTVPSVANGIFIDASTLPNGLTIDADVPDGGNRRVMEIEANATVALHGLTLTGGNSDERGGAIFCNGSGVGNSVSLSLSSCTISENSAVRGGGIFSNGDDGGQAFLFLNSCTVSGNSATLAGGGIYSSGAAGDASLSVSSCTVSENSATTNGGGIYSDGREGVDVFVDLHSCTVANNSSDGNGGGIYSIGDNGSTSLDLLSCTISGNSSGGNGGGIFSSGSDGNASLSLSSCTISDNSAALTGGGIQNQGPNNGLALLNLENTIVAGNSAGTDGPDLAEFSGLNNGTTTTNVVSNSLLSDLGGQTSLTTSTEGLVVDDPLLAPLADNGGPTLTHLPKIGSPVIDVAPFLNPGGFDQRGFLRFTNGLDIGAVEFQGRFIEFNADGDGDGASNGLEQAIGSDLFVADPENPANLFLEPESARTTPALRYRVDLSRQDDIILSLKRSFDLIDFDTTIFSNESFLFENESARIFDREAPSSGAFYRLEARPRPRP